MRNRRCSLVHGPSARCPYRCAANEATGQDSAVEITVELASNVGRQPYPRLVHFGEKSRGVLADDAEKNRSHRLTSLILSSTCRRAREHGGWPHARRADTFF